MELEYLHNQMFTAIITNITTTNIMITDTTIPAIAPADKPSDESLVVLLINESKKAYNTSVEVKLITALNSNSKVMYVHTYV